MLAVVQRSGLDEQFHDGAVGVAAPDGELTALAGDVDRPFFIRSAAKPFQALVSTRHARGLRPVQVALACASHTAEPVHVAIVLDILHQSGLDESALLCPPARPVGAADRRLAASGDVAPSPMFHNCSGKHAAMLAACVEAGWNTKNYLEPDHPLQIEIGEVMNDVSGSEVGPPGVDGCGAPVWRTTVREMARAFARLENDPTFTPIRSAMARYPALVSGEGMPDTIIARWLGAVAKRGAAGCLGMAVAGHGVAVKCWDGSGVIAGVAAAAAVGHLGVVTAAVAAGISAVAEPSVLGGGREIGRIRSVAALEPV